MEMFDASAGSMNALGQYTAYDRGNGLTSQNTFNALGMPVGYMTPGVQDLAMTWNLHNGNLINRVDYEKSLVETFTYDNLNRLTNSSISGQSPIQTSYQPSGIFTGNFSDKSDAGTYVYHPQKIHAVTSVTDAQNLIPSFQQDISYNAAHDPVTITENGFQLDFAYDAGGNRRETYLRENGYVEYFRYYFGACELNFSASSPTSWVHYIQGGDGLCAIVTKDGINGTNYYYPYQDHLGSILTITDDQGNIVAEQNFDAWGRKRHPDTWGYSNIPSVPSWLFRGYTGHEHLPEFGLIHMNGRMYDPILGRMLSPDNYVHGSLGTQGFNRYSYAGNNPLKYTDPSGEVVLPFIIVGAAVGGYVGGAINNNHANPFQWDWRDQGTYVGIGVGMTIGAAVGFGVGNMVTAIAAGQSTVTTAAAYKSAKLSFTSSVSGLTNVINHYDPDRGLGLYSLGYYAAGYGAAYTGIESGQVIPGAILNTAAGIAANDVNDLYSLGQAFTGGMLTAYGARSFYKSFGMKSTFTDFSKKAHFKFLEYGTQGLLADFAYDRERSFLKKSLGQHFGTFFISGTGGLLQSHVTMAERFFDNPVVASAQYSVLAGAGYSLEMLGLFYVKGNFQYISGSGPKATLFLVKTLLAGISGGAQTR